MYVFFFRYGFIANRLHFRQALFCVALSSVMCLFDLSLIYTRVAFHADTNALRYSSFPSIFNVVIFFFALLSLQQTKPQ